MFGMYGIVTIAIFFVGDSLGYRATYRIVIIAVVLLTLPFALVGSVIVRRRKKKKLALEKAEAEEKEGAVEEDAKPKKRRKTGSR